MRRPFFVYLLVLSLLALFGGFTWLTYHPDAEILRRAEYWPWVGSMASRFRQAYRQSESRPPARDSAAQETRIREGEPPSESQPPPRRVFRQQVWVLDGMELKARPSSSAATVYRFENLARAGKIESRDDWYHVEYNGRVGWVLLEGYDEDAEVPYGETPEPPRPVASRAPDEERLAAARRYLRGHERVLSLGPYTLYTDAGDLPLLGHLDTVADQLEGLYGSRYGVAPIGVAAEAVVMYQSDIAYRLLQQRVPRLAGLNAAGHNSKGVAVLYSGGRTRADVAATVVHELTHFLNRRAIGPQLPPWLDEGIADDLALSRIDDVGRIHPEELGGARRRAGDQHQFQGGLASLWRLRETARRGELPEMPELISSDWEGFVRSPKIQLHYAAASFWIRYLVEGEGGRHSAGFRAFLAAVAAGEPPTAETLQAKLGEPWSALNARYRAWIEKRAASLDLAQDDG